MNGRMFASVVVASLLSFVALRSDASTGVTVVSTLDPTIGQFPESITRDDDGNIYLSMANIVWKVNPDGHHTPVPFATLPIPASAFSMGLKFGPDGFLYAGSAAFDPSFDASHVWRISPTGVVQEYAHFDRNGFPNDLAFDDDGNLFVTDSTFGVVYKVRPGGGQWSVWLDDPLLKGSTTNPLFQVRPFGADGIVFDKKKRELYIGNLDFGRVVRVRVNGGQPGTVRLFSADPRLAGIDGLAFDKKGNLYGAINVQNQIAQIDESGDIHIVAQGGPLDGPSSVVFGAHGDKKTLYISSFAIGEALGLVPGVPRPSLDSIDVQFGGIDLP